MQRGQAPGRASGNGSNQLYYDGCLVRDQPDHDVGYLEFGLTYSFDLLVLCNEFIGQVRRLQQGILVNKEYLAVDAVRRVGIGGHFLGDEHTFNHFRENWKPDLTDRNTYEAWLGNGGTSMGQRTKARIQHILETHKPQPVSPETDKAIDRVLDKAEGRSRQK